MYSNKRKKIKCLVEFKLLISIVSNNKILMYALK